MTSPAPFIKPLLLAMLEPDADRPLLASLADYPDDAGKFAEDPFTSVDEIAVPGHDGDKADALLTMSKEAGAKALSALASEAVRRIIRDKGVSGLIRSGTLFDEKEMAALAGQLAASIAPADLLGRARIRLRQVGGDKYAEDQGTDFAVFDQPAIHPMAPMRALEYFRGLIPQLGVTPERFGPLMQRQAFTMAEATSKTVLEKVQKVLVEFLGTGLKAKDVPKTIDRILDRAGITPKNPSYSNMVFRTNVISAYNAGAQEEFSDPDVAFDFPTWRYSGIQDGRERKGPLPKYPDHKRHFGKYFDRGVLFEDVRGRDIANVAQCRCTLIPIFRKRWEKLYAEGVRVTPWP